MGTSLLTDQQKTRMLHHLGYPSWELLAQSMQLGFPAASQPLFLVYQAFLMISPGGIENALRDLCQCEAIEEQLGTARERMKATSIGSITLNAKEAQSLRVELQFWTKRLADDLGVNVNPYSQMAWQGMGGGIGGRTIG